MVLRVNAGGEHILTADSSFVNLGLWVGKGFTWFLCVCASKPRCDNSGISKIPTGSACHALLIGLVEVIVSHRQILFFFYSFYTGLLNWFCVTSHFQLWVKAGRRWVTPALGHSSPLLLLCLYCCLATAIHLLLNHSAGCLLEPDFCHVRRESVTEGILP